VTVTVTVTVTAGSRSLRRTPHAFGLLQPFNGSGIRPSIRHKTVTITVTITL
jgi:hypothetical protein